MYAINPKGRMIGSSFWTELQKMCLSVQKAHLSISNLVQPGYSGKICTETCRFSSKPRWAYECREGALETAWLLFYLSNFPLSIGKLFQLRAAAGFTFKCWNKSWKPNAECSLWVKLAADRLIARNMNNCNSSIQSATIPYCAPWLNLKVNEYTIAPWCHCKRWRHDLLCSWRNVIQGDLLICFQEIFNGFPAISETWKSNEMITGLLVEVYDGYIVK